MMDLVAARALLARPVPVALAARAFGCDPTLLAPLAQEGAVSLHEAFAAARRQAEERLRAVRFARRSAFMRARLAAGRAARAFVDPARLSLALAALRAAVAVSCEDLAARLKPFAPRVAHLAERASKAVLTVDPATTRRPKRRAAR